MGYYDNGQTGGYTGAGIPDVTRVNNPRQPATNNYLASNFFRLELTRLPTVTYFCQSVAIPSVNITPVDQPTPLGVFPKFVGGKYAFEDLTVNFIVDENMKNWLEVYNWINEIGNMEDNTSVIANKQTSDFFSDILIVVTNSVYRPNLHIRFRNAFPISLSGFQFNSASTDTEPIIASATFAYDLYEIDEL
tara:strand:- start:382 stop:954 length:573 start_codon:yes stop_codon:yes gene_type:complete